VIYVSGSIANLDQLPLSRLQRQIVRSKQQSPVDYNYESVEALMFELNMRAKIVEAAYALDSSGLRFSTFSKARANERYWNVTGQGGFEMKSGVLPSDAIRDIYVNGRLYATECATAILIVFYKGVLDTIGDDVFNTYFKDLYLRDWNYDSDLQLVLLQDKSEAYPGDSLYFKNPDHDPEKPEWQGENVIKLGDDMYYGHGLGVRTGEGVIAALNRKRRPGSEVSAYLSETVVHPVFEYLRKLSIRDPHLPVTFQHVETGEIVARIGSKTRIYRKRAG